MLLPTSRPPPGPPLRPTGAEGRRLLREELLHAEYRRSDLWSRLVHWIGRLFRGGVDVASGSSLLTALVTIVVTLVLLLGLTLLLTRVRRDRRSRGARDQAVLTPERPSAAALRDLAERAVASGRFADAVVDGFRALATRQIDRGRLEDRPGATAHEIAVLLASSYDGQRHRITAAADLFDAVRYGDRPATAEQAQAMLALDDDLARERVGAR
jgi:Domain of unknown function (DUF4129)